MPEVTVTLLQSLDDVEVKGLSQPEIEQFRRFGNLIKPHQLVIRLSPSERTISLPVRSVSIPTGIGNSRAITDIYVRRPLEPARFQEAVADLRAVIKELGAEENEQMKLMATWGDIPGNNDAPGGSPYDHRAGRVHLPEGVDIGMDIKPDPVKGWYYLLYIGVEYERRPRVEALRKEQAANAAASQPVMPPATVPANPTDDNLNAWKQWRQTNDRIDPDRLLNDPDYGPEKPGNAK